MSSEQNRAIELGPYGDKILSYQEAITKIKECRGMGLKVILAQGVFDIVHVAHLEYLRKAKAGGDLLFVGVENDLCIRQNKGEKRPFNNLGTRLEFLSQLSSVDYTFGFDDTPLYSDPQSGSIYICRYNELNPNAIAVTIGDPNTRLKEIQGGEAGVKLFIVDVIRRESTTRLLQAIGYE